MVAWPVRYQKLTLAIRAALTLLGHIAGMSLPRPALSTEVEAAWRFPKLNWALCAAITAVLAFSLLVTGFSLTLPGVAAAFAANAEFGGSRK